jgi:hypothetical protein
MATTYTLISSTVLGSNSAGITLSSIPQTYTDLVLRMNVRSPDSGTNIEFIEIQFNGNGSFTSRRIYSDGSTINQVSAGNQIYPATIGSNAAANYFAPVELYVGNYSQASSTIYSHTTDSALANFTGQPGYNGLRWNTLGSVNSIYLYSYFNFAAGSSFYLYGISKS